MAYLLFDIGGTKTRLGLSHSGRKIDKAKTFETSRDYDIALKTFISVARDLLDGEKLDRVAGGVAAMFDKDHDHIFKSPNLRGWEGKNITSDLKKIFGDIVLVENDAALAGLGEATYGAGKGSKIVMYMTVSTGVGGTRIVDGRIDEKVFDFEPGQQIIETGETLEKLISGVALEERFGKKAFEIPQSDPIWVQCAERLATGLYNSILEWQPEVVVLGGSMILGDPSIPIDITEAKLKQLLDFYPSIPAMKKAALGAESGLYGGLAYMQQK